MGLLSKLFGIKKQDEPKNNN